VDLIFLLHLSLGHLDTDHFPFSFSFNLSPSSLSWILGYGPFLLLFFFQSFFFQLKCLGLFITVAFVFLFDASHADLSMQELYACMAPAADVTLSWIPPLALPLWTLPLDPPLPLPPLFFLSFLLCCVGLTVLFFLSFFFASHPPWEV
jgi:hypothetical protein